MVENSFLGFSKSFFVKNDKDLHEAFDANNIQKFVELLQKPTTVLDDYDEYGHTVVDKAVMQQKTVFIKALLNDKKFTSNTQQLSKLLLLLAKLIGDQNTTIFDESFDILLKLNKLNINYQGEDGWSAISNAIYYKDHKMLEKLLSHRDLDVNIRSSGGYTPLMLAISSNNNVAYEKLLARQDTLINIQANNKDTAFNLALRDENKKLIQLMLNREDLDINLPFLGLTPLMCTANKEIQIQIIKDHRFDVQKNLLACVRHSECTDLVFMILELRGNELKKSKNIFYNHILEALYKKNFEIIKKLIDNAEINKEKYTYLQVVFFKMVLIYQGLSTGNLAIIKDCFDKIDKLQVTEEKKSSDAVNRSLFKTEPPPSKKDIKLKRK